MCHCMDTTAKEIVYGSYVSHRISHRIFHPISKYDFLPCISSPKYLEVCRGILYWFSVLAKLLLLTQAIVLRRRQQLRFCAIPDCDQSSYAIYAHAPIKRCLPSCFLSGLELTLCRFYSCCNICISNSNAGTLSDGAYCGITLIMPAAANFLLVFTLGIQSDVKLCGRWSLLIIGCLEVMQQGTRSGSGWSRSRRTGVRNRPRSTGHTSSRCG